VAADIIMAGLVPPVHAYKSSKLKAVGAREKKGAASQHDAVAFHVNL
jgi:hypothetical protein